MEYSYSCYMLKDVFKLKIFLSENTLFKEKKIEFTQGKDNTNITNQFLCFVLVLMSIQCAPLVCVLLIERSPYVFGDKGGEI